MNSRETAFPATRSFERALLLLHQARTLGQLGYAAVEVMYELFPIQASAVYLCPMGFKESLIFARPDYLNMFREWVREAPRVDVWMQRSPPRPGQRLIRHTDHTPDEIFAKTEMCRRMAKHKLRFGAAIQVWKGITLEALIIVDRSKSQGDFSDDDMRVLSKFYPYVTAAVERVFAQHQESLQRSSLAQITAGVREGILILNSSFKPLHFNEASEQCCAMWGGYNAKLLKSRVAMRVPAEIIKACRQWQSGVGADGESSAPEIVVQHPQKQELGCVLRIISVRGSPLDEKHFLVRFIQQAQESQKQTLPSIAKTLSSKERELVELICDGKSNAEAARELGKSLSTVRNQLHSIFQKLSVKRRSQLVSWWVKRNSSTQKPKA